MDHDSRPSLKSSNMGKEKTYKSLEDDDCFKNNKNLETNSMNRLLRNQAEKQRRDKLNSYISELASIVPMIAKTSKRLDKTSILRLTAAHLRLHFSCLNPENVKKRRCVMPENLNTDLNMLQQAVGGFFMVTTYSGKIMFTSAAVEMYLGYQDIDMMGHSIFSFIHEEDISLVEESLGQLHSDIENINGGERVRKTIYARMREKCQPRSHISTYRTMVFSCSVNTNELGKSCTQSETCKRSTKYNYRQDFLCSSLLHMFIQPVNLNPLNDMTFLEAFQDAYMTTHGLRGEILYADHRISTITGHLPNEVRGMSAYEYIYDFDVPVAQFAQKLMFTSNSGTGAIVYRLRTRNESFVYLQSSGHLEYCKGSSEISHFVCINQLLSDEEGSKELKKFQERLVPRIKEIQNISEDEAGDSSQQFSGFLQEQNANEAIYSNQNSPTDVNTNHLILPQSPKILNELCVPDISADRSPYEILQEYYPDANSCDVIPSTLERNIVGKRKSRHESENSIEDNYEPEVKKLCFTFQSNPIPTEKMSCHVDKKANSLQNLLLRQTSEVFDDYNFSTSKNVSKLPNANIASQNPELDLLLTNLLELPHVQVLSAVCDSLSPDCYNFCGC